MASLARWCFRHRWIVLLLWLVALLGFGAAATATGTDYKNNFSLPGTESQQAIDLLKREFPAASGETASIVLHARAGTLYNPLLEADAVAMLDRVAALPHVVDVTSPFDPRGARQFTADGRTAFATVALDNQAVDIPRSNLKTIIDTARTADAGLLQVEMSGSAVSIVEQPQQNTSELLGVVAAAIILFIAFGTLLAMTLPLIAAVLALGVGMAGIGLVSHVMSIAQFAPTLATLIGLGVGIDYALFIVNRHRIGLRAGKTPEEACVTAINTSGRAVLFAGLTVCIALLGMYALGVTFLYGVAISAALIVSLTMATAVTLLPALLSLYGMKVLGRAERVKLTHKGPEPEHPSGFWWRSARRIERRPAKYTMVSAAIIVITALPFFSLRLGSADEGNGSLTRTSRRAYDLLANGFGPGFNGPFTLVAETRSSDDVTALANVVAELRTEPGVAAVTPPISSPTGHAATVAVFPVTSPQDARTSALLRRLRGSVIPRLTEGTSLDVKVGGATATYQDFSNVLTNKLPLFIGVVVALAFLLLVAVFRSLLVPLTASVMNLLAVGSAFGVIVAIFQWGWLAGLIGVKGGPIEPFLPVMLFAILFGLSMDYEVFLVSRMHEEWIARRDNRIAVSLGQAETGRVITAAGAIMTLVFASFTLSDDRVIKLFGLGMAVAVLIDAFVIRALLVPALMHLTGMANWWLPSWLDRVLPSVSVESQEEIDEIRNTPVPAEVITPADKEDNATDQTTAPTRVPPTRRADHHA
ncbi:MMPL family transporter [Frankia sp. Cppng1_Ct_nod]|uniref:MMPL family transporter n=1 Tax=Frankia sp. Cppng1_Ct_nod TaxID=2897162 RepID=UPI0010411F0B|nr:MMPL family transporter [Frankia sp. Cppng1_Ct_nod]